MLKQASVTQIRKQELTRRDGYLVVAMCFYPRGLKKELFDEYRNDLAPDRKLFKEFKAFQAEFGHEAGFEKSHYEERFYLNTGAYDRLKYLTDLSRGQDVYFLCQCELGERCHREILMLVARSRFNAEIGPVFHQYPGLKSSLLLSTPSRQLK